MPNARRWPWWRAAPRATPATRRPSASGPASWPKCCGSTTRWAAIRKTWTRSSGSRSACSSRARPTTAAPSAWCGRRASSSAAFRELESRQAAAGADEHVLRARLVQAAAPRPWRHVVVAVGDRSSDPDGLWPADWDVLARLPGLERLDVVVTDATLAGDLHERLHHLLPGIDEVRADQDTPPAEPLLQVPPGGAVVHVARDREEEVAGFARRVKAAVRTRSARPPRSRGARRALAAALCVRDAGGAAVGGRPVPDVRRAAARRRALGRGVRPGLLGHRHRVRARSRDRAPRVAAFPLRQRRRRAAGGRRRRGARPRAGRARLSRSASGAAGAGRPVVGETGVERPSRAAGARGAGAGAAGHASSSRCAPRPGLRITCDVLLAFLTAYEAAPGPDDPAARAAAAGARRHPRHAGRPSRRLRAVSIPSPVEFDDTAAVCRRWIEAQTFAPLSGERGVHLVDSASARFGDFDDVQLAGLVEGEWPDLSRRSIFYSPSVLRELGWPSDQLRLDGVRAEFADLLRLPSTRLTVSTFALEADALVSTSSLRRRAGAQRARRGGSLAGGRSRVRARGARSRPGGRPRAGRGAARVGRAAAGRGGPRRVALPRRDRGPSGAGLFADRARALHGLSVQVLRGGRASRRGAARRSVGALAARARTVHPRSAAAVLRGVGPHRARPDHGRDARPGARGGGRGRGAAARRARRRGRRPRARAAVRNRHLDRAHRPRARARSGASGRAASSSAGSNIVSTAPSPSAPRARGSASMAWPTASICSRAGGCG